MTFLNWKKRTSINSNWFDYSLSNGFGESRHTKKIIIVIKVTRIKEDIGFLILFYLIFFYKCNICAITMGMCTSQELIILSMLPHLITWGLDCKPILIIGGLLPLLHPARLKLEIFKNLHAGLWTLWLLVFFYLGEEEWMLYGWACHVEQYWYF